MLTNIIFKNIAIATLLLFSVSSLASPETNNKAQQIVQHSATKKTITLTVANRNKGRNRYFTDLLEQSLIAYGYQPDITYLGVVSYQRQMIFLNEGSISLMWRLRSPQRDKAFMRVDTPLTGGLIGQRIFFITKGTQHKFDKINSLADLQASNLVGGFGEKWFDIEVWQHNNLPYLELRGATKKIYPMLRMGDRGFDYFSRGLNEILNEQPLHPQLDVEQKLLVTYPIDSHYYLGKSGEKYHQIISEAMQHAEQQGLIKRLIQQHFGDLVGKLNLKQRRRILLKSPITSK